MNTTEIKKATNILEALLEDENAEISSYAGAKIEKSIALLLKATLADKITGAIERGVPEPIVAIPHIPTTNNEKHQAYLDWVNNFTNSYTFAEYYGITVKAAKLLINEGRKIHKASVAANLFTVITVSENTNSFGLKSILLLNEQGEGWQILKSPYGGEELPKRGDTIERVGDKFKIQYECPSPLKTCKPALAKSVIAEAKKK